jgi:hypothetical protein
MNPGATKVGRLESLLAGLLHYGTWLASAVIGVGLVLALMGWRAGVPDPASWSGMCIVTWGIGLFIVLPVLRVTLMLVVFVYERDYRFVTIAAFVLAIIVAGLALGMHMAKQGAHAPVAQLGPGKKVVSKAFTAARHYRLS